MSRFLKKAGQGYDDARWRAAYKALAHLAGTVPRNEILYMEAKMASRMFEHFENASAGTIAQIALTYGKLGVRSPAVIGSCHEQLKRRCRTRFSVSELTSLAWAPVQLQLWHKQALLSTTRRIESRVREEGVLVGVDALRLHQVSLAGRVTWGKELLGPETAKQVASKVEQFGNARVNGSRFQDEVTKAVRDIVPKDWKMEREYFCEGYFLDIAFPEQKLAVEANGPSHYYPGTNELTAKDQLKEYLLKGLGWTIISVHYKDWQNRKPFCLAAIQKEI